MFFSSFSSTGSMNGNKYTNFWHGKYGNMINGTGIYYYHRFFSEVYFQNTNYSTILISIYNLNTHWPHKKLNIPMQHFSYNWRIFLYPITYIIHWLLRGVCLPDLDDVPNYIFFYYRKEKNMIKIFSECFNILYFFH